MTAKKKPPLAGEGRAEILAVALKAFATHGFEGTSTSEIARAAGVTQPLVYHHFKSKQALWDAVMDELFGDFSAEIARAIPDAEGWTRRDRLAHLLKVLVRFSGRRPEMSRLIR